MLLVLAAGSMIGCVTETPVENSLNRVLEPQPGDDDVVAVVQGRAAIRGDVREAAEFWMRADDSTTSDEATRRAIVLVIDRSISQAEVERRKLTPTLAEAEDYMRPHREACLGEHGAECREALQRFGFDAYDESYWEDIALPEYARVLGEIRLFNAVIQEKGLENADEYAIMAARRALPGELRKKAVVLWRDKVLEQAYLDALASEQVTPAIPTIGFQSPGM